MFKNRETEAGGQPVGPTPEESYALGLVVRGCGDRETAALMGLPLREVRRLLRSGLTAVRAANVGQNGRQLAANGNPFWPAAPESMRMQREAVVGGDSRDE